MLVRIWSNPNCKIVQQLWKTVWQCLIKLHMYLPYWPHSPTQGYLLTWRQWRHVYAKTSTRVFSSTQNCKTWKQPECPSRERVVDKWDLDESHIIVDGRSQCQKITCCMLPFVWLSGKDKIWWWRIDQQLPGVRGWGCNYQRRVWGDKAVLYSDCGGCYINLYTGWNSETLTSKKRSIFCMIIKKNFFSVSYTDFQKTKLGSSSLNSSTACNMKHCLIYIFLVSNQVVSLFLLKYSMMSKSSRYLDKDKIRFLRLCWMKQQKHEYKGQVTPCARRLTLKVPLPTPRGYSNTLHFLTDQTLQEKEEIDG